jgi:hypothetical protein
LFVESDEEWLFILVISAVKNSFNSPLLLAVIFILDSACGDKYKYKYKYKYKLVVLCLSTKKLKNPLTCRMCAALEFLLINKTEEGWLMVLKILYRMRN